MKTYKILLSIVILAFLLGCATTNKSVSKSGKYLFAHMDKMYLIESFTPATETGNNFLVLKDGDKVVFKAIDKEQNGYIDEVLLGDISLEEARKIYSNGLAKAAKRGNIENHTPNRFYQFEDIMNDYYVSTYNYSSNNVYNRLTIIKKNSLQKSDNKIVILDLAADGSLNKVLRGECSVDEYQNIYNELLNQGVRFSKISNNEGKFFVLVSNK